MFFNNFHYFKNNLTEKKNEFETLFKYRVFLFNFSN